MLGRTAEGLFWMFRYLERSENTARLIETGLRISMTRSSDSSDEWASVLETAGAKDAYQQGNDEFDSTTVIDFLLRSPDNPVEHQKRRPERTTQCPTSQNCANSRSVGSDQ